MKKETTTVTTPFWRDRRIIPIILQIIFICIVVVAGYILVTNALSGMRRIGINPGYTFLKNTASFVIPESTISYTPTDSYGRALLVGFFNTLRVAIIGVILTSIIGFIVGVSRLSKNWLVNKLAAVYIEIFRNTPLLVQIFIWYFAVFLTFPRIEQALGVAGMYFSNRGIAIPWLLPNSSTLVWVVLFAVGVVVAIILWRTRLKRQIDTGTRKYPLLWALGAIAVSLLLALLITRGVPANLTFPALTSRGFTGGYRVSVEFAAILIGLVVYTSTFIAEIVRAGILGVPNGQVEAANALGLKSGVKMRLVILPQAIRIIIPPLTSQYLNLIKNSSLAVAVGYADIVQIGGQILNHTGRAVEVVSIWIMVYLSFSLLTSLFMNFFNKKFQLVER